MKVSAPAAEVIYDSHDAGMRSPRRGSERIPMRNSAIPIQLILLFNTDFVGMLVRWWIEQFRMFIGPVINGWSKNRNWGWFWFVFGFVTVMW